VVARDLGQLPPEGTLAGAHDAPPHAHAVGVGDGGGAGEPAAERVDLAVEPGVERQLLWHGERRDEDDAGATVRGEPAGEVERVLGLGEPQERDDDAAVPDRDRPPGEAAGAAQPRAKGGQPHLRSW
jgi:hypothetical protein